MTGPRARRPWLALVAAAILAVWIGGFIWFVAAIPGDVEDQDTPTDAIVVLTGGSLRVQNGLTLLAQGRGKKLFVSGVYHSTDVNALLHAAHQQPEWLACCIVLGRAADNTHGNAAETAIWIRNENFHSLRLVTSSYHMPRSLLEFTRAMPDIRIVPHAVFPESMQRDWWFSAHAASLVVGEYIKYLLALARLQPEDPPT